ncbi:MAG: hypothetical protein K0R38_608 [Polyangiaceae bacterium]|jgi:hypothetical protein|nr:hypothetical protein [Polyangiaceae bacterium]
MERKFAAIGVGLVIGSLALPALAADVVISDEARAHFSAGVNLLQDPDGARYEEAYREFKAAYATSPSWKILGNLGLSAMKLERDSEAIEAIKKYLAEGGKKIDADERAQFQRDLATLESGVAQVVLQSEPPGATIEDERHPASGQTIRNSYVADGRSQIGVRSGRHRFTAKLAGRADAVWEVELSPKQQVSHTFTLPEPATASPVAAPTAAPAPMPVAIVDTNSPQGGNGLRTGAYIALGAGVVGLAAGTIFGLSAKSKYKEANDITNDNCPGSGSCELPAPLFDQRAGLGKDGDSAKTLSIVGFALGGVGLATGVTLFVLSNKKEGAAAASVQPYVGVGQLGFRGGF